MTKNDVLGLVQSEFNFVWNQLAVTDLSIREAAEKSVGDIRGRQSGIYVFFTGDRILKVGKHQKNARKRALEHIADNTGGQFRGILEDASARLLIISFLKPQEHLHWLIALEVFLESRTNPIVRSARVG